MSTLRLTCTLHESHAGHVAFIRDPGRPVAPAQACELIRLAHSPWARAASIVKNGPWPVDPTDDGK